MDPNDTPAPTEDQLRSHTRWVQRLARALVRDPHDAEDVAQDALVAALQRRPTWPDGAHARSWLFAALQRLALRRRRERAERPARERRAARREASDAERDAAARLQLYRRLNDALVALPEPYRTTVTLRYLDGLPPRAIARRLGRSAEVVRQHASRGLAMLRRRLDAEFGDRRQWLPAVAAVAAGSTGWSSLIPVLAMKKTLAAAAVVLCAGAFWLLDRPDPAAPSRDATAAAGAVVPAAAAAAAPTNAAPPAAALPAAAARTPAPPAAATFAVRVLDPDGRPIAGAALHAWRAGDESIRTRRTDANGLAEWPAHAGAGGVLLDAPGWPRRAAAFAVLAGAHELRAATGARVAGTVHVDGELAPAGLELTLDGAAIEVPATAPRRLRALFSEHAPTARALTDATGNFAFDGLAADWRGKVRVPWTHWLLADDRRGVALAAPRADLVLRTTRLPVVAGRVVWADDGTPVAWPDVMVWAEFAGDVNTPSTGVAARSDGSFAVGLRPSSSSLLERWQQPDLRPALRRAVVTAQAAGSDGRVDVEWSADQGGSEDLVIRLPRAALTHYRAVDPAGDPVAGAVTSQSGSPTDADGRGSFQGPRDQLLIGAPGFRVDYGTPQRDAAGTPDDPLVFVLQSDSELRFVVRCAVTRLRFEIAAERLFAGDRFQRELDRSLGSTELQGHGTPVDVDARPQRLRDVEFYATVPADGVVTLRSLQPGVPATITLRDGLHEAVLVRELITPQLGESHEVELVVPGAARELPVRVVDAHGAPVRASVQLVESGTWGERRTDADGRFTFGPTFGDGPWHAVAWAQGHAPSPAVELVAGDAPTELRLGAGHTVTCRVVDATGAPVDAMPSIRPFGRTRRSELGPGVWRFADLPAGEVTLSIELGDRRWSITHDATVPDATLRLGHLATVRVHDTAARPERDGGWYAARFTRLDEPGAEPFRCSFWTEQWRQQHLLLVGRYRVVVVFVERGEPSRVHEVGSPAEVTLQAGADLDVRLR